MNLALGIGLKIASALAFTLMAACAKLLNTGGDTSYSTGQIVFARSLFALVPVFLWLAYDRALSSAWRTKNIKGHVRRGLVGTLGMFSGFAALSILPLSDATAISYAAPLITVVLAALVLKETVRIYRWTAVVIGFIGVIVMLVPYAAKSSVMAGVTGQQLSGALLGLLGATCAAFATIEVRRLTATEKTGAIVFYFSVMTTMFGLITLAIGFYDQRFAWTMPNLRDGALLVMVGMLGGIGQITLTQSYRYADASMVAPFDYTSMVWAVLVGYLLFGDLPDTYVMIGSTIVIASGIFVILRERALGIERKKQRKAGPSRAV